MTRFRDPIEIYRESLAAIPPVVESHPPTIERAEVWPYPDLTRVWVRLQTSPFAAFPNVALTLIDPEGQAISSMMMVEIRDPYQSVTLHVRQQPRAGARYTLEVELSRDEAVLDVRTLPFDMVFREPTSDAPSVQPPAAKA